MKMQSNTILITGGNSGIGRGLAEAFHRLGNRVVLGGRREEALAAVCEANPGMNWVRIDVTDPGSIDAAARRMADEYPDLNGVISNAGVQRAHDFAQNGPIRDEAAVEEVATNLLGVIRVASAFLPLLRRQAESTLIHVSSGLAFVPLARFPVYCATKAAVHSLTQSMRHQLRGTGVKLVELIPPYVATELGRESKAGGHPGPPPMPLETFIEQAMKALEGDGDELAIGDAANLVAATASGPFDRAFAGMNR